MICVEDCLDESFDGHHPAGVSSYNALWCLAGVRGSGPRNWMASAADDLGHHLVIQPLCADE